MGVAWGEIPQGGPGADIVPADVDRQHGGGARLLHHGVVDGDVRSLLELRLGEAFETDVFFGMVEGGGRGGEDLRLEAREFVEERLGVQNENAAVPEVVARREILFGRGGVGLFGEAGDRERGALEAVEIAAGFDVAVAGMGARRLDAEQDELAGGCDGCGAGDGVGEPDGIDHRVIRRHDGDHGIRIFARRHQSRHGDGRRGIAGDGLENDRFRWDLHRFEFAPHQEAMIVVTEDDRRLEAFGGGEALKGRLQKLSSWPLKRMNCFG